MRIVPLCLIAILALGGCVFQNLSSASKLRDSVEAGNEGARWARMDIAMEQVAPEYMREFLLSHYDWGEGIQMADLDILRMQMAEDEETATVVVAFGWYAYDTMSLERTVIRQKWRSTGTGYYVLAHEEVIDGDERLLEPEEVPEDDADDADDENEEELAVDDDDDAEESAADDDDDDELAADDDDDDDDDDEGWVDVDGEPAPEAGTLARAT